LKWGSWIISYDGKPHHRHYILRHATRPFTLFFPEDSKSQWFYKKQGILFCVFATDDILSQVEAEGYFNYLTEYTDSLQQIFITLWGTDIPHTPESVWLWTRFKDHITFTYKKTGDRVVIPRRGNTVQYIDWATRRKTISIV